jgi:hypothetical protein
VRNIDVFMQLHRKKVLSAKRVGQNCATTKDQEERNYQTLVRFHLYYSTSMWADDDIERNITSSDVEFLTGEDVEKVSNGTTKKDKQESNHAFVDNAKHVLTTPDLSGFEGGANSEDVVTNDMSVLDQIIDKELTLSHTARRSPQILATSEKTLVLANLSQSTLKYPVLMLSSSTKKARLGLSLHDSDSSFGNTTGIDENR